MYTLTINGNTPEELFANLEKAAIANRGATPATVPQMTARPPIANPTPPAVPMQNAYAAAATTNQPPTAPTAAPVQDSAPPPAANQLPSSAAPTYSLDALARAGATLAQSGKMTEALALLARYGVQTVNQLKPEQYGAFATELRALGARV
jgi:hypothetical protein